MINLPYNEILKMIQEKTGLSQEEITAKVNDKLNQLSGLVSKEGAAHIIANELNVSLLPKEGEPMKINQIPAGMRNVQTLGKVQQIYEVREFNSARGPGKVGSFLLGDDSGVIRIVLWNDQVELMEKLNQGDVLKIENAYSRDNNGRKEIHLNDSSKVSINPEGANVGEVKRPEINRKNISDLTSEDSNVEVLGTIVQVFDIRFFEVDPDTKRRIKPNDDGKFYNQQGEEVTPDYSFVSNIFIDDGSSNIRVVCFKNQLENLLNKDTSQILQYRTNPEQFEDVKHDLLGHIVKIRGRVVNNEMFNRLEIVSNMIITDPDPQDEINRLKKDGAGGNLGNSVNSVNKENPSVEPEKKDVSSQASVGIVSAVNNKTDSEQAQAKEESQESAMSMDDIDDNSMSSSALEDDSDLEDVSSLDDVDSVSETEEQEQEKKDFSSDVDAVNETTGTSEKTEESKTQENSLAIDGSETEENKEDEQSPSSENSLDGLDELEDIGNIDEEFFEDDENLK
ncbi:MAG: OB-fold nucleic acid binding domain-containing protein [Candidatus Woesearchaeota archaeon]